MVQFTGGIIVSHEDIPPNNPHFCFFCGGQAKVFKIFKVVKTVDINPIGQEIRTETHSPIHIPHCNSSDCALKARHYKPKFSEKEE